MTDSVRILLIGDTSVGKTSIIKRYIENKFDNNFISTVGCDFREKKIKINDKDLIINIMDTCGQERYYCITKSYYRNADGIIFVFDLSNKSSYNNINKWLTEAHECNNEFKKILVGNKLDLVNIRDINKETVINYAEKKNLKYYEVSALDGTNVNEIFREIAELIINDVNKNKREKSFVINKKNKNNNCCK